MKEICKVATHAKDVTGDGKHPDTKFGPLCNRMQFEKIKGYVESVKTENGNILCGGKPMGDNGFCFEPTIVTGLGDEATIVKEEQFGPVLPILPYVRTPGV